MASPESGGNGRHQPKKGEDRGQKPDSDRRQRAGRKPEHPLASDLVQYVQRAGEHDSETAGHDEVGGTDRAEQDGHLECFGDRSAKVFLPTPSVDLRDG